MTEQTFFNIDLATWANILVALATFTLAAITFLTVRHMRRQMVLIHKQTLLSITQQNPLLNIEDFKIRKNQLIIQIKNIGSGNAYQIGVNANFDFAKLTITGHDKKKRPLGQFTYDPASIIDTFQNMHRQAIPIGLVNYISKIKKHIVILKPNQSIQISMEPFFYLKYSAKLGETSRRAVTFTELVKLLKENKRSYVEFSYNLVYKNALEDTQDSITIAQFVFDVNHQHTLEDAYRRKYHLALRPLSPNEVEQDIGFTSYEDYRKTKSMKNYIPGEKDTYDFF